MWTCVAGMLPVGLIRMLGQHLSCDSVVKIMQLDDIQECTELALGARVNDSRLILAVPSERWQKLKKK